MDRFADPIFINRKGLSGITRILAGHPNGFGTLRRPLPNRVLSSRNVSRIARLLLQEITQILAAEWKSGPLAKLLAKARVKEN